MITPVKFEFDIEESKYFYPITMSVKTHKVCATIIPSNTKKKNFSYLTVTFPHKSIRGNLYVMVVYYFGSNTILAKPIKKQASRYHM